MESETPDICLVCVTTQAGYKEGSEPRAIYTIINTYQALNVKYIPNEGGWDNKSTQGV